MCAAYLLQTHSILKQLSTSLHSQVSEMVSGFYLCTIVSTISPSRIISNFSIRIGINPWLIRISPQIIYKRASPRFIYMVLILSGTLTKHLADINEAAHDRTVLIVKQIAKQQGITEQLKSSNWLTWLQAMNNIQASARELVFSEIVYA